MLHVEIVECAFNDLAIHNREACCIEIGHIFILRLLP